MAQSGLNVLRAIFATTLLLASTPAAASPEVFVIGKHNTKLAIVIPDGYCLLDVNNPSDNRVLTEFDGQSEGKHRRLAFMVSCEQLHDWRNGDLLTFSDFGYVLLPEESVDQESDEALDVFLNVSMANC